MEAENKVSVWIGYSKSEEFADESVFISYSDEGEAIASWFSAGFGVERIDPDFTEVVFRDSPQTIPDLLDGVSYDEQILENINNDAKRIDILEAQLGVLLYNFEYGGQLQELKGDGISLIYVGVYEYEP